MSDNSTAEQPNPAKSGMLDVHEVLSKILPFPRAYKGESTEEHFSRMSRTENENAYLTARLGIELANIDEPESKETLSAIFMQNAEYLTTQDLSTLPDALLRVYGRHHSAQNYINAARSLRETAAEDLNSFSPNLMLKLEILEAAMESIQRQGTRVFADSNGIPTTYTRQGLISLIPTHIIR